MDGALTFIHICVNSSQTVLEHLQIWCAVSSYDHIIISLILLLHNVAILISSKTSLVGFVNEILC